MSRHDHRRPNRPAKPSVEPPKRLTAEELAEIEDRCTRNRKRREYVARKVSHWERMGTPTEINPLTGAAVPKWKLEADKLRAKKLRNECHRHCNRHHRRVAAS